VFRDLGIVREEGREIRTRKNLAKIHKSRQFGLKFGQIVAADDILSAATILIAAIDPLFFKKKKKGRKKERQLSNKI
jgi:hypothetical protein